MVRAPVYSHLTYDIVDGEEIVLRRPDIVIVEGLNVLQAPVRRGNAEPTVVVSDFFDFTIYVDAAVEDIEQWYLDRLVLLRETALRDPESFFHFLTAVHRGRHARVRPHDLARGERREPAGEHRADAGRAHLVLEKAGDHRGAPGPATKAVTVPRPATPRRPNHASSEIQRARSSASTPNAVSGSSDVCRPTDSAMPTSALASTRRCASDAGISISSEMTSAAACDDRRRRCARTRDRCGSTRRTAAGTPARLSATKRKYARKPLSTRSRPRSTLRVAAASVPQQLVAGVGRAARCTATACSGSAGRAPAW